MYNLQYSPKNTALRTVVMLCFALMCMLPHFTHAEDTTQVSIVDNGTLGIKVNGKEFLTLKPTTANNKWKFSAGVKTAMSSASDIRFTMNASGVIDGKLVIKEQENNCNAEWNFSSDEDVSYNILGVSSTLAFSSFKGGLWKTDGKQGTFPKEYGKLALFSGKTSVMQLTTVDGSTVKLQFSQPQSVMLQDNRRWGGNSYTMRIGDGRGGLQPQSSFVLPISLTLPGKVQYNADGEVIITADKDWIPLVPELDIVKGSALDLSVINSTYGECGSKGRIITTKDGHFALSDHPGKPLRFYGANLCFDTQFMEKEKVDVLLDRWLQMGYNTLRIHHYEFGFTPRKWQFGFDWSKEHLDKFCYLIAECSKRGIWLTTDLYVSRPISPEQINLPANGPHMKNQKFVDAHMYKALVLVYEPAYKDFLKFSTMLLNYVNPYTKRRLADEPALAWINLLNEGAPGDRIRKLPQWKTAWNKWLAEKYPTRQTLANAIGDLQAGEKPEDGTVNFPEHDVMEDTPRGRVCQVFMADMELRFINKMKKFLRDDIKCQALLSNHNCKPHNIADQLPRSSLDYVDNHFYVDHPIYEKGHGLPTTCNNTNPLLDGAPGGADTASIRIWGKPLTVSEYNYSGPGRFRAMAGLLTGSLAAIQDWDVLWRFAYAHKEIEIFTPQPMDFFNLSRDPLSLAADRAAVMLFLRGDMKPAEHKLASVITKDQVLNPPAKKYLMQNKKLDWVTRIGSSLYKAPSGAIAVNIITPRQDVIRKLESNGVPASAKNGLIMCENGQLTINMKEGQLCIDTPKTAGGFATTGKSINAEKAGFLVDGITTPSCVYATSIPDTPLISSPRILVTHLTDLQNTGTKYSENNLRTLLDWGKLPYLVRSGKADIHLKLQNPQAYTVWALSLGGRRVQKIPARITGHTLTFTADIASERGACLLYEVTSM